MSAAEGASAVLVPEAATGVHSPPLVVPLKVESVQPAWRPGMSLYRLEFPLQPFHAFVLYWCANTIQGKF